jgi:hypothetical protein
MGDRFATLSVCQSLLVLAVACGSAAPPNARDVADANDTGRTVGARSESERALLGELTSLPSNAPRRFRDATVVAEPPYAAASGHTCRAVHVTTPKAAVHRLACGDGKNWFFVPDVFGSSDAGALE